MVLKLKGKQDHKYYNFIMCGRYALTAKEEDLVRKFLPKPVSQETFKGKDFEPRYNITPSLHVLTIRQDVGSDDSDQMDRGAERSAHWHRWGLVPLWAVDAKIGYKMINARSETVAEKPAFGSAIKYRRCLLPASGFFEWQRKESYKPKTPYYFYPTDGEPLAMAGLWETWKSPNGGSVLSCCILTTEANALMEPIHHRMPVLLDERDYDCWLDRKMTTPEKLKPFLKPCREGLLSRRPVSSLVNSPKNDGPEILAEINPDTGYFVEETDFEDLFKQP